MHRLLAEAREAAKNWEENTHKSARELEILRGEAEGTVSMLRARLAQVKKIIIIQQPVIIIIIIIILLPGTVSMLRARLAQAEQKARLDLDQASL